MPKHAEAFTRIYPNAPRDFLDYISTIDDDDTFRVAYGYFVYSVPRTNEKLMEVKCDNDNIWIMDNWAGDYIGYNTKTWVLIRNNTIKYQPFRVNMSFSEFINDLRINWDPSK